MTKEARGGKRANAGRKPLGDKKRVRICCTISPETKQFLDDAKKEGTSAGKMIDKLREYFTALPM